MTSTTAINAAISPLLMSGVTIRQADQSGAGRWMDSTTTTSTGSSCRIQLQTELFLNRREQCRTRISRIGTDRSPREFDIEHTSDVLRRARQTPPTR